MKFVTELYWTTWYKHYNYHPQRVRLQGPDVVELSWRHGQYSQRLQYMHIVIVWLCSISKTTIHSSGSSCIQFHHFHIIAEHWWSSPGAHGSSSLCTQSIWEHLGASGRVRMVVQSCWVVQWCNAGGSIPRYTQREVSLLSMTFPCLAIGLDIWTDSWNNRWFTSKHHLGSDSN